MSNSQVEVRIYVACLAAYNNGVFHRRWIDAEQDANGIRDEISAMLKASPISGAEAYAIHDYEGFEGVHLSEYVGSSQISDLAAFIGEHGALGGKLLDHYGGDLDDARLAIEDSYCGRYRSAAEFAEELTEQSGPAPGKPRFYIDYEAMARDLKINYILMLETRLEDVHVYWWKPKSDYL